MARGLEVTIRRQAMVTPSEATPDRILWNSNVDLVIPRIHTQSVYFYRNDHGSEDFLSHEKLAAALAKTLVPFYPMAGRLRRSPGGRVEINCNAQGVLLVEAQADAAVADFGEFAPDPRFKQLVPQVDYSQDIASFPLLVLQVTFFRCGGASLGVGMQHHVADGMSGIHCINTWSGMARGIPLRVQPFIDRTLLKANSPPAPKHPHIEYQPPPRLIKGEIVILGQENGASHGNESGINDSLHVANGKHSRSLHGATGNGIHVGNWKSDGIHVENGKSNGVHVENGKSNGVHVENGKSNGVHVENGKSNGVQVENGKSNGVHVENGKSNGVHVENGKSNGVHVENGKSNGVHVENGKSNGVHVENGKSNGVHVENGKSNGVHVENGKSNGVHVENGKSNGVHVENGKSNGIHVENGKSNGVDNGMRERNGNSNGHGGSKGAQHDNENGSGYGISIEAHRGNGNINGYGGSNEDHLGNGNGNGYHKNVQPSAKMLTNGHSNGHSYGHGSEKSVQEEDAAMAVRVFRFTKEQLATLKKMAVDGKTDDVIFSSYAMLSGHIWKCVTQARDLDDAQETKLFVATDGRNRLIPPLPPGYFGNVIFTCTPIATAGELVRNPVTYAARKIHDALARMNDEYLRSALDYLQLQEDLSKLSRGAHHFNSPNLGITSWARMPVYECDFGWGRPIFMGPCAIAYEGLAFILASPVNDGSLSLSLGLRADHMATFAKLVVQI